MPTAPKLGSYTSPAHCALPPRLQLIPDPAPNPIRGGPAVTEADPVSHSRPPAASALQFAGTGDRPSLTLLQSARQLPLFPCPCAFYRRFISRGHRARSDGAHLPPPLRPSRSASRAISPLIAASLLLRHRLHAWGGRRSRSAWIQGRRRPSRVRREKDPVISTHISLSLSLSLSQRVLRRFLGGAAPPRRSLRFGTWERLCPKVKRYPKP